MLDEPYEVIWAEPAIAALDDAYQYLAKENLAAADNFIAEVQERISQLTTLPDLGFKTNVRHLRGRVREVVVGRYRILYQSETEQKRILILLVWHTSRRNPRTKDF